jgi:hypothetical protein
MSFDLNLGPSSFQTVFYLASLLAFFFLCLHILGRSWCADWRIPAVIAFMTISSGSFLVLAWPYSGRKAYWSFLFVIANCLTWIAWRRKPGFWAAIIFYSVTVSWLVIRLFSLTCR